MEKTKIKNDTSNLSYRFIFQQDQGESKEYLSPIINFITDYPLGKKVVEEIVVGKHAN